LPAPNRRRAQYRPDNGDAPRLGLPKPGANRKLTQMVVAMKAKLNDIAWVLGCIGFALAGAWLAYGGLVLSGTLGGWSRTPGQVLAHYALKKNVFEAKVGHTYNGGITYRYEVGGNVYRHSLSLIQVTQDKISDFYAKHPKGETVTVLYRPERPQESRLAGDSPGTLPPWAKVGLGAVFFLLGVGMAINLAGKAFKQGG